MERFLLNCKLSPKFLPKFKAEVCIYWNLILHILWVCSSPPCSVAHGIHCTWHFSSKGGWEGRCVTVRSRVPLRGPWLPPSPWCFHTWLAVHVCGWPDVPGWAPVHKPVRAHWVRWDRWVISLDPRWDAHCPHREAFCTAAADWGGLSYRVSTELLLFTGGGVGTSLCKRRNSVVYLKTDRKMCIQAEFWP